MTRETLTFTRNDDGTVRIVQDNQPIGYSETLSAGSYGAVCALVDWLRGGPGWRTHTTDGTRESE